MPLQTALAALARLAPHSSALEQPGNIFVHDERDTRPREHAHEVCRQAAVKPRNALMRPRMRNGRRDRAMMRARQRRVDLYARADDLVRVSHD